MCTFGGCAGFYRNPSQRDLLFIRTVLFPPIFCGEPGSARKQENFRSPSRRVGFKNLRGKYGAKEQSYSPLRAQTEAGDAVADVFLEWAEKAHVGGEKHVLLKGDKKSAISRRYSVLDVQCKWINAAREALKNVLTEKRSVAIYKSFVADFIQWQHIGTHLCLNLFRPFYG